MAFIINKKSKTRNGLKTLFYLVENYREDNRIRRRTVMTLGENNNLTGLLKSIQDEEEVCLSKIKELEDRLYRVKNGDFKAFLPFCPPYRQVTRITEWIKDLINKSEKLNADKEKIGKLIQKYPKCSANKA